jgi:hypothetical protein
MKIGVVSSKKPWAMLVFVLVAVNAIVALTAVLGVSTPLDALATSSIADGVVVPMDAESAPVQEGTNPYASSGSGIALAPILALFLWIIILFGLYSGHQWAWWLMAFSAIFAVVTAIVGFIAGVGAGMGLLLLLVNVLLILGLFHRQSVEIYRPTLSFVKKSGWSF